MNKTSPIQTAADSRQRAVTSALNTLGAEADGVSALVAAMRNGLSEPFAAAVRTILSAPLPFRVFWNEPANVWVTRVPWVWLPAVLVLAALLGHIVVYRRLRAERRGLSARRRDRPVPP